MEAKPEGYQSYLLRMWQVQAAEGDVWRASLVSVQTGRQRSFADLESLSAFLKQATEAEGPVPTPETEDTGSGGF